MTPSGTNPDVKAGRCSLLARIVIGLVSLVAIAITSTAVPLALKGSGSNVADGTNTTPTAYRVSVTVRLNGSGMTTTNGPSDAGTTYGTISFSSFDSSSSSATTTPTSSSSTTTPTSTTTTPSSSSTTTTTPSTATTPPTLAATTTDLKCYYDDCPVSEGFTCVASPRLCYKFHESRKNWTEAQSQCLSEGSRLIVVNTDEKFNYIGEHVLKLHSVRWTYVGLKKADGVFTWLDGSTNIPRWGPWQPGKTEECGWLQTNGVHDAGCNAVISFVCEIPV